MKSVTICGFTPGSRVYCSKEIRCDDVMKKRRRVRSESAGLGTWGRQSTHGSARVDRGQATLAAQQTDSSGPVSHVSGAWNAESPQCPDGG